MTVFSHGNMAFGHVFVVFSFLGLWHAPIFILGYGVCLYITHKSQNMENLWALAINKSIIFIMSTMYGICGIVAVGHGSMFSRFLVLGIHQIAFQTMCIEELCQSPPRPMFSPPTHPKRAYPERAKAQGYPATQAAIEEAPLG
jgi:hypothetical protein